MDGTFIEKQNIEMFGLNNKDFESTTMSMSHKVHNKLVDAQMDSITTTTCYILWLTMVLPTTTTATTRYQNLAHELWLSMIIYHMLHRSMDLLLTTTRYRQTSWFADVPSICSRKLDRLMRCVSQCFSSACKKAGKVEIQAW